MPHSQERVNLLAEGLQLQKAQAELLRKRPVNVLEHAIHRTNLSAFVDKVKSYRARVAADI